MTEPSEDAPTYRLLYLDRRTGWIDHYDEFEAVSDDAATQYARTRAAGRRLELWRGHERLLQSPVPEIIPMTKVY